MTHPETTATARDSLLQRDGACLREVVARRHGRRRNPARTTPRSSLRTLTNPSRDHNQRWVEKVGRSIKGSDTPHCIRTTPSTERTPGSRFRPRGGVRIEACETLAMGDEEQQVDAVQDALRHFRHWRKQTSSRRHARERSANKLD